MLEKAFLSVEVSKFSAPPDPPRGFSAHLHRRLLLQYSLLLKNLLKALHIALLPYCVLIFRCVFFFLAAAVRIGYEEHMPGQVRYVAAAIFLRTDIV